MCTRLTSHTTINKSSQGNQGCHISSDSENDGDSNEIIQSSLVIASTMTDSMVLPAHIGFIKASFAVDTGASVNVLSERAYTALRRISRGGKYPLEDTTDQLMGVSTIPLHIMGTVHLPITLVHNKQPIRLKFYIIKDFSLASDGLLGLKTLKEHNLIINPQHNVVHFAGLTLPAMEFPAPLIQSTRPKTNKNKHATVVPLVRKLTVRQTPCHSNFQIGKALVIGSHEIPARTGANIPVKIPRAPEGSDVCIEGPSKHSVLSVESTLNTVGEARSTSALVVNQSDTPVKIKDGLFLSEVLIYPHKIVSEPMDFPLPTAPSACVAPVSSTPGDIGPEMSSNLGTFVTKVDYPESKHAVVDILQNYRDVIALPGEPLGQTTYAQHHIKLKTQITPVYIPAYRLAHSQRAQVDQQVEQMLQQGVIQPSTSAWNSPMFLVPKKSTDGITQEWRPVIDYRRVNKVTEDDRFHLPVLKDLLMSLGSGNSAYSSLDLLSGYWQVPMAPESRHITAFSTPNGHWEFLRMPFGLKNAPITFQRMMNSILGSLVGKSVFVYLDDIIIFSKDIPSHLKDLSTVLQRLREAGLKIKLTKCDFLKKSLHFLGHMVDQEGIHTADDKIKAIQNFPTPKSIENVRSFLGLSGYYRSFIRNFSSIASPLNILLRKETQFTWGAAQERSFQELKHALTHAPVLIFPNFNKPFIVYTDASALGLGAVLMQTDDAGKHRAIAYASRTLNNAESNYSVTHQEALAVVWALNTFKDLIFGYPITIYTDHTALTHLFEGRKLSGRLARWDLTIQEFNPTFQYVPGRANRVADSLSRNVPIGSVQSPMIVPFPTQTGTQSDSNDQGLPEPGPFTFKDLHESQRAHDTWGKVIYHLESGDEVNLPTLRVPLKQFYLDASGILCRRWEHKGFVRKQTVIPEKHVPTILNIMHDTAIAGHQGKERTLMATRRLYFWPTMRVDIDSHIDQCLKCAQNKGSMPKPAPILTYPPPTGPWDVVGIDLLQLPMSDAGSRYLLVTVDHFSRFVVLAPIPDKTATTVAHALVNKVFLVHSTPSVIISDNGSEFHNALMNEICQMYNIKQAFITAYHASSNGLTERCNRKILEVLRPIVGDLHNSWENWLPQVAASINGSVCESTGHTPHFILYGVEMRLPYERLNESRAPVYNVDSNCQTHMKVFSKIHQQVQKELNKSKAAQCARQHKMASPVEFKPGDTVMVLKSERRSKLSPKFSGPRVIESRLHGNKFSVRDPLTNEVQVIHNDLLKRTKVHLPTLNTTPTKQVDVPPPAGQTTHHYNLRSRYPQPTNP